MCGQPQLLQGKYRLVRLLGQGGFGIVYEALDMRLSRHYAVKMITTSSSAHQKQVEAEANILAQHARQFCLYARSLRYLERRFTHSTGDGVCRWPNPG